MTDWLPRQLDICAKFGASFTPSSSHDKLGVADNLSLKPLNGLRQQPQARTCGWYLWSGPHFSGPPEYFSPLQVSDLERLCPDVIPFLGLAPG